MRAFRWGVLARTALSLCLNPESPRGWPWQNEEREPHRTPEDRAYWNSLSPEEQDRQTQAAMEAAHSYWEAKQRRKAEMLARDEADLEAGVKTREDLRRQRSLFAGIDPSRIVVRYDLVKSFV